MAERKKPKDIGSDSPGSRIAKEQRMAGISSGPREVRNEPAAEKQPPQTSNRRGKRHEHEPTVRKGYEAAENPEAQGDGDPGPDQIRQSSSQQGHAGRDHGGGAIRANDVVERSHEGSPGGRHTREGRQRAPGDRDPQQPS